MPLLFAPSPEGLIFEKGLTRISPQKLPPSGIASHADCCYSPVSLLRNAFAAGAWPGMI